MPPSNNVNKYCSFCGRKKEEVNLLIKGKEALICDICAENLEDLLQNEFKPKIKNEISLYEPSKIKTHLDNYIIGQDKAKKVVSVAVYNHYKRILNQNKKSKKDDIELEKSNILLVGETGSGKTLIAKTIAKIINVPFCVVDATVLTEAGYVGEDIESILSRLLQVANYEVEAAEKGIVFIDEIDKIARKGDNPSITRDVSGEGVQQGLLKLLEGSQVNVPPAGGRKHPEQRMISVNTNNILFICGGAFDGIENIIKGRLNANTIGYSKKENVKEHDIMSLINATDLKKFGLIPELIGRLPNICHMEKITKESMVKILTEPKNAIIKQYQKLFDLDEIKLEFESKVIDYIAEQAIKLNLGARGLRGICEKIMLDLMYETPSKKNDVKHINIDLEYVVKKLAS